MLRSRTVCVCVCGVYVCSCVWWWCVYVCLYVRVCTCWGVTDEWGWVLVLLLLLPKTRPKYIHTFIHTRQGSILSVGIAAAGASFKSRGLARLLLRVPTPPVSLRDRRGLYFGGGCLIPRADPGLWVCGCVWAPCPDGCMYVCKCVCRLCCFVGISAPCTVCMYVCMSDLHGGVLFLTSVVLLSPARGLDCLDLCHCHCHCCCSCRQASWFDAPGGRIFHHPPEGFANLQDIHPRNTQTHTHTHTVYSTETLLRRRGGETCMVCVSLPVGHDNRPPLRAADELLCVCVHVRVCAVVFHQRCGRIALRRCSLLFRSCVWTICLCLLLLWPFLLCSWRR